MGMIAYHGDERIKVAILKQLKGHRLADQMMKGVYWEDGRGCGVGCTIHSSNHAEYETQFGIPQMLARLKDRIFEGLPNGHAKEWPERFMSAIAPGADLSRVGWQFLHWLLTDETVNPGITNPAVKGAVRQCADVGLPVDESAAWSAESAESAESAAWSAVSAARSAGRSAGSAARSAAAYTKMGDKLIQLIEAC